MAVVTFKQLKETRFYITPEEEPCVGNLRPERVTVNPEVTPKVEFCPNWRRTGIYYALRLLHDRAAKDLREILTIGRCYDGSVVLSGCG
jgi:hypothetical protein